VSSWPNFSAWTILSFRLTVVYQITIQDSMPNGKVYLVGAGPGDAELITLKGYQLICQADVILYDQLIPPELLPLAKPTAELIPVGKHAGKHTLPQEKINELLIEKAKENKIVVRLKGGDPFLFGRGGEEAEAFAEAKINFEVVPGVTSALAAPSYAGIPPTHRDFTSNVAIVTGHRRDKLAPAKAGEEIEIPKAGTIIFLMGVANIQKIVDSLLKAGWSNKTKIAAIENGTFYNQRVITGTLENFVQIAQNANLKPPAVFIVGKVVSLHQKLNWLSSKPKVLVLGTHPEKYKHLGTIVHRPIVKCIALDNYSHLEKVIKQLQSFDWLIFTSPNGVRFFFEQLRLSGLDARALHKTKVAAIGKTTAAELSARGISADLVPAGRRPAEDNESSAGLLEKFSKYHGHPGRGITGWKPVIRVLIPRAEVASSELPEGLTQLGAAVEVVPVYKTIEIEPAEVDFDYIDIILFTSGSVVRAFVNKFGKVPSSIKAYCLGLPTLAEAKKYGIDAELMPRP